MGALQRWSIEASIRLAACLILASVAGCASNAALSPALPSPTAVLATTPSPKPAATGESSSHGPAGLTYVAFGDSWPYGAHCNGCRPFPVLLEAGFAELSGRPISFVNDVTNGGTAEELAAAMQTDAGIRADIAAADIIVIAIGGNDMGPAFDASAEGTCGGADDLDCFRAVRDRLGAAYEAMLLEVEELRAGQPTAIRMVTTSNEFLADPALIELFGADFGSTGGATVTVMNRDVQCAAAAAHRARCVDLGVALNGPELQTPRDVNTQATMQMVADAILAAGLPELSQ